MRFAVATELCLARSQRKRILDLYVGYFVCNCHFVGHAGKREKQACFTMQTANALCLCLRFWQCLRDQQTRSWRRSRLKDGVEKVWLPVETRLLLRKMKEKDGVSVSGFIRGCVLQRLKDEKAVEDDLKRLCLAVELNSLSIELSGLRRVQVMILSNYVYLRDYARELVKGDYRSPANAQLRRSILCYPGAEKALPALEKVFARREEIGQRMCEIVGLLYPKLRYEQLTRFRDEYVDEHNERRSWSLRNGNREVGKGGEREYG
jgi:hypothetical protein